ncbi:DUF3526 domain-containing protein [Larkinella punicea]|uniref:DUF3526 domain-containing protein n=1 Tax=Larkinella punicea TaxID=2315727 RepID=A0A368JEQ3_9BACT|nr:DUF3526 domain-containing protein [Larkinella punicea]RCR65556.1 DUF3526 domain-containing protein [Larkinella punicea]
MTVFWLILKNDWLRLRRGRALAALLGIVLLSGLYAFLYGQTFVSRQQATIAEVKQDERTRLDSLAAWARLDTSIAGNKPKWATATNAYEVNVPEGYRFAVHEPSALAPLSLGMRDLFPYYQDVGGRAIYRQLFQQEIANPQKLSVGHFDWAFVVIFLLPLLLITLSYNLLSTETELGTYSLLRSQPVTLRQIVLAKVALRLLLVMAFLVGLTLLAVPVLGINLAQDGGLLVKFLLVSVAYLLFWGGVIFAVVSFQKPSAFNALVLLGCWLVLVVALPTLLQQVLTMSQPIDRTTFENLVRDQYSQEQPDSVVLKPYYARHPDYYFPNVSAKGVFDIRPYYARNEQLDRTLAPLVEQYETAVAAREATVSGWHWLLPAINALELFNGLAGTSATAHRDYIRQIRDFHTRWNAFFLPKVFKNERLTPADYDQFPAWQFQSTAPGFAIGSGLLKLLLGTLLLFGLGWWRLNR